MIKVQAPMATTGAAPAVGRKLLAGSSSNMLVNATLDTGSAAGTASVLQRLQTIVRQDNGDLSAALSTAGLNSITQQHQTMPQLEV